MPTADIPTEDTEAADAEAPLPATHEASRDPAQGIDTPAAGGEPLATNDQPLQDAEEMPDASVADAMVVSDAEQTAIEQLPDPLPEPPPPLPIQLILWNEIVPASAGCWVFWREAGFECRGKVEKGLFAATCRGLGGSVKSAPVEILLRRRFVSQGEAIAVLGSMLSFDPQQAESLGFEITGRAMLQFLPSAPVSGALDEEQPAVGG